MKTSLIVGIIIGVIVVGSFSFVYGLMHDCMNPPIWMKVPKSDFGYCWGLFVNGNLPDYPNYATYEAYRDARDAKLESASNMKAWVSLPVTSCAYPWHEANNDKTRDYFEEFKSSVENYDSSSWQDVDIAVHYVIKKFYEDRGIAVHEVQTIHNRTLAGVGQGCNTTSGGIWYLQIFISDLDYFLSNGFEIGEPKPEPSFSTKSKISFGSIEGRKILPLTVTEITPNPESHDEVTKWGFSQINITIVNLGKTWGNLPEQYLDFDITDENGDDILDKSKLPQGMLVFPADLHLYHATCDNDQKIVGESHHPTIIPIKPEAKTIFIKSTSHGIYPDEEGLYRLNYFSVLPTEIEFPKNAQIVLHQTKLCKLEKQIEEDPEGKYTHGSYIKAIFRLQN